MGGLGGDVRSRTEGVAHSGANYLSWTPPKRCCVLIGAALLLVVGTKGGIRGGCGMGATFLSSTEGTGLTALTKGSIAVTPPDDAAAPWRSAT